MKSKKPQPKAETAAKTQGKPAASHELSDEQLERVAGGRKAGGEQEEFLTSIAVNPCATGEH